MAKPGWFNDNEFRQYPFVVPSAEILGSLSESPLPESAIVDAGCIMSPAVDFQDATDYVYLHAIRNDSGDFLYVFRTTAAAAAGTELVFRRSGVAADWETERVTATLFDSDTPAFTACGTEPLWEGFLTHGRIADLAALLPGFSGDLTWVTHDYRLEPGCVQNLRQSFLQSLNLANYDRTHWTADADCTEAEILPESVIRVQATCLTGAQQLVEGYNTTIRQDDNSATFTIGAVVGGGAGLACAEVPLYDGEEPPAGSTLLAGGPNCTEILKTLNGVGGRIVKILGGPGVIVKQDPDDEHGVLIDIGLQDFITCGGET